MRQSSVRVKAENMSRDIVNQNVWKSQLNKYERLEGCDTWKWCLCQNQLENYSINQNLKKLFHSDTLLEGSVKLTSMQLVGEFVAAISVHLDAIMKLENVDYSGKRLSESAVESLWNWNFSDLGNITRSKPVEENWRFKANKSISSLRINLNQSSSINPKKSIKS